MKAAQSFHIREDTRHTIYTDKMEFHVLELPKLPKELREDSNDIELWGKYIRAERLIPYVYNSEEYKMIAYDLLGMLWVMTFSEPYTCTTTSQICLSIQAFERQYL